MSAPHDMMRAGVTLAGSGFDLVAVVYNDDSSHWAGYALEVPLGAHGADYGNPRDPRWRPVLRSADTELNIHGYEHAPGMGWLWAESSSWGFWISYVRRLPANAHEKGNVHG